MVAYFECGEFANYSPPDNFLAVDRKTLSDVMEPIDEREDWEAIIAASYEVMSGLKMRCIIVLVISRLDMVMTDDITRKPKAYILT